MSVTARPLDKSYLTKWRVHGVAKDCY